MEKKRSIYLSYRFASPLLNTTGQVPGNYCCCSPRARGLLLLLDPTKRGSRSKSCRARRRLGQRSVCLSVPRGHSRARLEGLLFRSGRQLSTTAGREGAREKARSGETV